MRSALTLCVLVGALLVVGTAPAASTGGSACRKVKGIGAGQDLGGGNTVATITNSGLLKGTTAAHFDITGGAVPVLTFAGSITFTTKKGLLTLSLTGTFDVSTGAFVGVGVPSSGTGRFAGATGSVTLSGVENLATGAFAETLSGTLCLAGDDEDGDDD